MQAAQRVLSRRGGGNGTVYTCHEVARSVCGFRCGSTESGDVPWVVGAGFDGCNVVAVVGVAVVGVQIG